MSWEKVKLGDVATFVNGYPFKPSDWVTDGLEIIRIQNLTKGASETNFFNGSIPAKYRVLKGDILISWSATLDIFVWDGNDAWLNQHIFKVVFDKIEIDKNYFIYAIKNILGDMRKQVHGATMQHITKGKFDNLQIPLPPLSTQKRIAEILDAADALRRKDQELLQKYDELAQAIFIDMFGDPVKNEKGWEVKKLGECLTNIQIGPFGTQLHESDYIKNGIPIINPMHIGDLKIKPNINYSITKKKFEELQQYHLKPDDVILGRRGEMGRCAIVTEELGNCLCGTGSLFLTANSDILDPLFLVYILSRKSTKKALENISAGSTMSNLNKKIIYDFNIILPDLEKQKIFAKSIKYSEKSIQSTLNSFELSNSLFQTLLQKAFKGELIA